MISQIFSSQSSEDFWAKRTGKPTMLCLVCLESETGNCPLLGELTPPRQDTGPAVAEDELKAYSRLRL